MKIIIIGCGKVGYSIAERLVNEDHDITVVDTNATVLADAKENLDILAVLGNGAAHDTLEKAGTAKSDIVISTTNADETNLLACIMAKKLGCKHTIARVRNPQYTKQLKFLKDELGLSLVVNPDSSAALEMRRIIQFPFFLKRDSFAKGKIELVEIKVSKDGKLAGKKLFEISGSLPVKFLVCVVERDQQILIPKGDFEFQEGDQITIAVANNDLAPLIKSLGGETKKIRNVTMIGCSRIAEYLTDELEEKGIAVKVIERDAARCEEFKLRFPKALVLKGDASKTDFLKSVRIETADAVVTLTGIDEENIITSMYCMDLGVKKTITKLDRTEYIHLFKEKIDSFICPKDLTTSEIVRYVRSLYEEAGVGTMRSLHYLLSGKVEAIEFSVPEPTDYTNVPIKNLKIKSNILLCCVSRGNQVFIPHGNDTVQAGDSVVVVASAEQALKNLSDIFVGEVAK